jgi:malonate decarboxylase epsilon subunit
VDVAFLFPGQGSREPGMLHHLISDQDTEAGVREMSGVLGFDVLSLDSAKALKSTIGVQLSSLAAGVATAPCLPNVGICPSVVAGMSVGALPLPLLRMRSGFQMPPTLQGTFTRKDVAWVRERRPLTAHQ